ncbi:MAG TPA: Asp-tRNA(Asn)/Glu-tRNA(Gln) amidotransferase subunit GatB [Candidatus Thermoplasmatota archaeon]|jgi:aspartyl-tRNA(Asn)/glutamyl-tRNA(Gln) amidotransferase subunit B|nr:Asp-tRNA(Asn)/Glu-tRNA(Gln) amidotransferase subunit GatB [Candidatus Thermoplasmatota archaeon]
MSGAGQLIGLEVHAYLATQAKMFCACPNRFWDAEPNTLLCPVCTAQPGAKPLAPNAAAFELGLQLAGALGCDVTQEPVRFLRKHYFYPDLPSNYQRTSLPFARGGQVAGVTIREIHWEEDPGAFDPKLGIVDFNRSGAPLIELVTEPEVKSPAHARELLEEVRLALSYLGALAPAGMKADANISLQGGERVEVKNLNSARNVELALQHEAKRQAEVLAQGQKVARETRHFDETFLRTAPLRAKESEEDYRYLPDPDLPALAVAPLWERVRASQLPSPFALRAQWVRDLAVTPEACAVLLAERGLAACFLELQGQGPGRDAFEFLVGDLKRELNYRSVTFAGSGLGPADLAPLLQAQAAGLPRARAVALLRTRLDEGAEAFARALAQESTASLTGDALAEAVRAAIAAQPKAIEDYRKGKREALHRVMGDAMKRLGGRADPAALRAAIVAELGEPGPPEGAR